MKVCVFLSLSLLLASADDVAAALTPDPDDDICAVENNEFLGRPVDVMQMKDGSLLVSDDHNGAVYRISYSGKK